MIVVDTNVVSELMKPIPSTVVTAWVHGQSPDQLYTTAVTVAEIWYGIERLPTGRRKELLRATAEEVFAAFPDRILAFDAQAGQRYALIVSDRDLSGAPINGFDAQIAAICSEHAASLATRNGRDFVGTGIPIVDPWGASQTGA